MARKGKDLFVLLGERLNPSSQKGRHAAKGAGGWFRSLFRAVSDSARQDPARQARSGKGKSPAAAGRRNPPRVPRGLLVPGWFVIMLLLLGVSAGFMAGRWSVDRQAGTLALRVRKPGGVVPAVFPDGDVHPSDHSLEPGYLPLEKQERQLSIFFFRMLDYPADQRDRAEALARYLRGQGLENTRIRKLKPENGAPRWLTLCYVNNAADGQYSTAHAKECYDCLKRVPPAKFEPRLKEVVERLESADDLYYSDR